MKKYDFRARDALGNEYEFEESKTEFGILLTLKKENIKAISNIYALGEFTAAKAGNGGFYAIPRNINQRGDILTRFDERPDCVHVQINPIMAFLGLKRDDVCCLVRIERNYKISFRVTIKEGEYKLEAIFDLENEYIDPSANIPPEDIRIELVFLNKDADYNDMARAEREIRLSRGEILPLSEKCKREAVEYARKYPLVRIRMGWKPSPSPIKHQTVENEPPMHVACDFKRVRELADEFKRQGIKGAEFQLVGWNIKGHDGRWPQIFPIEEEFGGESEMIKTVEHVKSLGYEISTHTNLQDAYVIADNFSWNDIALNKNGEPIRTGDFSAGYPYFVCTGCQLERAKRDYPRIRVLGENGIHYTDIMSILMPEVCHNPMHPMTFKQGLDNIKESIDYQRELFGAFSSEGGIDAMLGHIDYGLYVTFGDSFGHRPAPIADEYIRLWEVAYHGTVLYNPSSPTINYPVKTPKERLDITMLGGKPSVYFYSKFRTGGAANWMGEVDFTCDTDEDMKKNVSLVKSALEDYEPLRHLQLVYMDRYDALGDGIEVATYSDGTRIVGNYTEEEKNFEGRVIKPFDYVMIEKE
ncbi:MAG: hypothetical protein IJ428_00945 [Clostridia bacterium]|nr:hypothetical protein [Clostridia bacterium]